MCKSVPSLSVDVEARKKVPDDFHPGFFVYWLLAENNFVPGVESGR